MGNFNKCIKKVIKSFDAFGTFITFRINEEIEYKSLIGGCSTIFFVMITLGYTFYCSYGFLSRNNVSLIYTSKVVEEAPFVNLTKSQFAVAFGIQFSDTDLEAEEPALEQLKDYFNYSILMTEWTGEDDIVEKEFPYHLCQKSDFYNKVNDSFETNGIGELYCPIFDNDFNFTIEGTYTDYFYKFMTIKISLTDEGIDALSDPTNQILRGNEIEMAIFWLDTAIDYESRTNPVPSYINYSYKTIDFDFIKKTSLYISSLEFRVDDHLLWDNQKLLTDAMLDVSVDSFRHIPKRTYESNKVGEFLIQSSSKIIQVSRSYQKFPSFLADMTSLLEEILVLLLLTVNFFERKAVDHKLVEKMLKYKGSKYFDVDYLISVFNKDKISNNVMSAIEKQTLNIERKNNISCRKKVAVDLLNNNLISDGQDIYKCNNYNIFSQRNDDDFQKSFDKSSEKVTLKKNKVEAKDARTTKNDNFIYREPISPRDSQIQVNGNNYIEIQNNFLSSNKNSIYSKQELIESKSEQMKDTDNKTTSSDIEYPKLNLCHILWATICFWSSKKQKKRYDMIEKVQKKIHYYLDIYTYIKKMQEIDIMKYCLFDEDQLSLIKFLSKPPVKLGTSPIGIYKEFEEHQVNYQKINKNEIDNLFRAYNELRNKKEITFEDLKLLRLVKAEVNFLK